MKSPTLIKTFISEILSGKIKIMIATEEGELLWTFCQ